MCFVWVAQIHDFTMGWVASFHGTQTGVLGMEKDWSHLAEHFDEYQLYITGKESDVMIKDELSKLRDLGNLLELGCGMGNYTKALASNCSSILATDISADMVQSAKRELANFSNIRVEEANCYETHFEDEAYDSIFMGNLIHVVAKPSTALQEAYRLLKPNGRLILISFTSEGMAFFPILRMTFRYLKTFKKPPKGTPFNLGTLTTFVEKHHFVVEEGKLSGSQQSKFVYIVARKRLKMT